MKQKFELGQKVWAFKQVAKELKKAFGIIQTAELDASGFIFYKVAVLQKTPEGVKVGNITVNHASVATTEKEIDEMMATYHKFQEEQKELFNKTFGGNEFEPNYIETELTKGA